jgi:hypothetical protein
MTLRGDAENLTARANQPAREFGEDRQVGVQPNPVQATSRL